MLGEQELRWAVGVPGRAAGHVPGVLIITGTETPAPCSLQMDLLALLTVPLGEGLSRCQGPEVVPDPVDELRKAAERRRELGVWGSGRRAVRFMARQLKS